MKKPVDMDVKHLQLGLDGIRSKIRANRQTIVRLHEENEELGKAEESFKQALHTQTRQQGKSGVKRKRIQKGLPEKVILEFLNEYGDQTWESIHKRAVAEKNLSIPRSTILGNLKRLVDKGLVTQVNDEHWRLQGQDIPPIPGDGFPATEPPEDFPVSVEEDDDMPF